MAISLWLLYTVKRSICFYHQWKNDKLQNWVLAQNLKLT